MVRYENEDRCWGKHAETAAGQPCTGCAWLIKHKYSERHIDRQTEQNIFRAHICEHSKLGKKRAGGPAAAAAAADAAKRPRLDADQFRIVPDLQPSSDVRSATPRRFQDDDAGYVDPNELFAGVRDKSTGRRHEKTPVTARRLRVAQRAATVATATKVAASVAQLPDCSVFAGFPWLSDAPTGPVDDDLIAQLALA